MRRLRDPAPAAPRWREIFAGGRGRITLGLVVVEALAGVQSLVVTATMPRVLADLHGVAYYGWVFSGYSLAGLAAITRAGTDSDRHGPRRPFVEGLATFGAGTILCGIAPSMPVLALVRVLQGYGGATLYTVAYGAVAKVYPERVRARALALLTLVWVGSGLVGPAYGAAVAASAGWRWSFLSVLPFVGLSAALLLGPLGRIGGSAGEVTGVAARWPLQLAVGAALVLAGLSSSSVPLGLPLVLGGGAIAGQTLRHVLPPGTLRARAGFPATVLGAFLTQLAFFAADSFVPLMLTGVRHTSLLEASVAVTLVTLGWSAGGWWQSRVMSEMNVVALVRWGAATLALGIAGTAAALAGAPLALAYSAWVVAGVGMGVAYSTLFLAALGAATAGSEGRIVAARFVSGRLGISLGTGLGGASVAIAAAVHAPLAAGLAGIFGLSVAAALVTVSLSGRLRERAVR